MVHFAPFTLIYFPDALTLPPKTRIRVPSDVVVKLILVELSIFKHTPRD